MRLGLSSFPDLHDAIAASPVPLSAAAILRIVRHPTETAMLSALEVEVAARLAPKPPSAIERLQAENDKLRQRVAVLEAEISRIAPKVINLLVTKETGKTDVPPDGRTPEKQAALKVLADKQAARAAASTAIAIRLAQR